MSRLLTILIYAGSLLLLFGCKDTSAELAETYCDKAYACHYSSLDSVKIYTDSALVYATDDNTRAKALSHKAFVYIQLMRYEEAEAVIDSINQMTEDQIELLVNDVQQMRINQRRSHNKEFYDVRERARMRIERINEERMNLTFRQNLRLLYAESEYHIASSAYYYYVGLKQEEQAEFDAIPVDLLRKLDTQQFLTFLYYTKGPNTDLCITLARNTPYTYWLANALDDHAARLQTQWQSTNAKSDIDQSLSESLLSVDLFAEYGDPYQTAGTMVTLSRCYFLREDYDKSLDVLLSALHDYPEVLNAPGILSTIYEQLSLTYSALNNKQQSDYYRNLYLDLHEFTRQDRQLESRADLLQQVSHNLNVMLVVFGIAFVLIIALLVWASYRRKNVKEDKEILRLKEILEEADDELQLSRHELHEGELRLVDNRAKVSALFALTPLIDRLRHASKRLGQEEYILELINKIDEENKNLTDWIQLRKGSLRVRIESFKLQQLFDMIAKAGNGLAIKGVELKVVPTELSVKADRILTLFMLNTLTDNARRFTHKGGSITIKAEDEGDMVVLSVTDTGDGMDEEQVETLFSHGVKNGHGFGLMNCRGIIEQYKKTSSLFKNVFIKAESEKGRGSRFSFALPKALTMLVFMLISSITCIADNDITFNIEQASAYADSAYYSNINGTYDHTIVMVDSCLNNISSRLKVNGSVDVEPVELIWFNKLGKTNKTDSLMFVILLDVRNEAAVAALALHEWQLYKYNNNVYTRLYKEISTDNSLEEFCSRMTQAETDRRIAVSLLVCLLILIVPLWYFLFYHKRLRRRFTAIAEVQGKIDSKREEQHRLKYEQEKLHVANNIIENLLSTIKHETMYYPSRLKQLLFSEDSEQLSEVAEYYSRLNSEFIEALVNNANSAPLGLKRLKLILTEYLERLDAQPHVEEQNVVYTISPAKVQNHELRLLTQIVRDLGESLRNHQCGVELRNDSIMVTLPRKVFPVNNNEQS